MSKPRRRDSVRARRVCFDTHRKHDDLGHFMLCAICGGRIDPVRKPSSWQADHWPIKWVHGGEDVPENLRPLCDVCFPKVNPEDWKEISHGKRMGAKHFGLERKRPFR